MTSGTVLFLEVDCRLSFLRETEAQVAGNLQHAERLRLASLMHAILGKWKCAVSGYY